MAVRNHSGGRVPFKPSTQQRAMVEAMVGYGIPHEEIANIVIDDRTGKNISYASLQRHFKTELRTGATKINTVVSQFMVASILGREAPPGSNFIPLANEAARASLANLFAKARMKWTERTIHEHEGGAGGPIIIQVSPTDAKL